MNYLIALGSNLHHDGETPADIVRHALRELRAHGLRVRRVSRLYRTPAYPPGAGPDFVNAAASVSSEVDPRTVLSVLHKIEAALGRERRKRWEARIIDLDILACDGLVLPDRATVSEWIGLDGARQQATAPEQLVVPHPRLHERGFVLVPLADIAADWRHPILDLTVAEMLAALPARSLVGIEPVADAPDPIEVADAPGSDDPEAGV